MMIADVVLLLAALPVLAANLESKKHFERGVVVAKPGVEHLFAVFRKPCRGTHC